MSFLTFFFFFKRCIYQGNSSQFQQWNPRSWKWCPIFYSFLVMNETTAQRSKSQFLFSFLFISLCLCTLEKGVFYWLFFLGGWGANIAFFLKDYQLESLSKELFCVCFFRPGPSTQKIRKFSNDFFFKENWQPFGLSS